MFKIIAKDEKRFHIQSPKETGIIPITMYYRAKYRKEQQSDIRNPVQVIINNELFIFTRNEWTKCGLLATGYKKFTSEIYRLYKMDMEDSRQKSPTVMKARDLRAKLDADTVGYLRENPNYRY